LQQRARLSNGRKCAAPWDTSAPQPTSPRWVAVDEAKKMVKQPEQPKVVQ